MLRDVKNLIALLLLALPAFGQGTTLGSISGSVFDPSSAAIPGARVTVLNTQTGVPRVVTTNSDGFFQALSLIPGIYSVDVTAPNFNRQLQDKLKLDVAGAISLTFRLSVGQVSEAIRVEAEGEQLKATEGVISTTIDNTKVVELPLNGRNFNNLIRLTPGATRGTNAVANTLNGITFAVAGSRSDQSNYTLDGTYNNGTFFKTAAIAPSIDAISEFKIQTNMSAKFGAAGGANIAVSIRSGTNEYHGSAYEFLRNSQLDARDYFAAQRPPFKFNQFGFTLGGPLSIPKLYNGKNRTFFFFNYEAFKQRRGVTQLGTVPNAAWKSGDLSRNLDGQTPLPQLFDPNTERQTGVDAQGRPVYTRETFPNNRIPLARMPAYVRAYMGLWFPDTLSLNPSVNNSNFINSTGQVRDDNQTHTRIDHKISDKNNFFGRVSWTDAFQSNPASLPNASQGTFNKYVGATFSDTHIFNPTTVLDFRIGYLRSNLGSGPIHRFVDVYRQNGLQNVPTKFRDFDFPVNFNIEGVTAPGNGNLVNGPDFTYQGSAALTKIVGKQTIAFGYDYTQLRIVHDSVFVNFGFNNVATSDPQNVARTGHPFASFLLGLNNSGGRISGEADLDIAQKLHHLWFQDDIRLTSKLTVNVGMRYEYNEWPHHRRGRMGGFDAIGGDFYWTGKNPITGAPPNIRNTIADPQYRNFAPRVGFAYRLFPRTVIRSAYGIFFNPPAGWEWSTGRGNWPYAISDNLTGINIAGATPTRADQFFGSFDPSKVIPTAQHTIARDLQTPYMQNWNFGFEHQLTQTMMLDINYQGAKGTNLSSFLSTNDPAPGPGDPNPRRPFPKAGAFSELKTIGSSRYHALTAKAEQRLFKGLTYIASYAYQKSIDLSSEFGGSSPQNNQNIKADLAPSGFDQTHVFNSGYSYMLPGANMKSPLKWLVGGWQTTGIVTLETGRPFNINLPFDNANIGARGSFQRPNLVGNPYPDGWTKTYGPAGRYFNPDAFAAAPQFQFGNLGRNVLRGPGFKNFDIGMFKNFNIRERIRLQYRAEFFNLFNMVNFSNPGGALGTPGFGRSTGTQNQQRSIQMGLKLYY